MQSMVDITLYGDTFPHTGSSSKPAVNRVASTQRGKTQHGFEGGGKQERGNQSNAHREAMKNPSQIAYHQTKYTGADSVMTVCTNLPNHQAQGRNT